MRDPRFKTQNLKNKQGGPWEELEGEWTVEIIKIHWTHVYNFQRINTTFFSNACYFSSACCCVGCFAVAWCLDVNHVPAGWVFPPSVHFKFTPELLFPFPAIQVSISFFIFSADVFLLTSGCCLKHFHGGCFKTFNGSRHGPSDTSVSVFCFFLSLRTSLLVGRMIWGEI